MLKTKRKCANGERGAVMIAALIFAVAVSAITMYLVSNTLDARHASERESNHSSGLAAAEFGVELAISEIADGLRRKGGGDGRVTDSSVVTGDWILGDANGEDTLYETNAGIDPDQRRIRGVFANHEYRVRVRSARLAYENKLVGSEADQPLPEKWIKYPGDFVFGKDQAWKFRDTYEITSTARRSDWSSKTLPAYYRSEPVVQAIVNYEYKSPYGSMMRGSTFNLEKAENFQSIVGTTAAIDQDAPFVEGEGLQTKNVSNIKISGEDHTMVKEYVEAVKVDRITTPLRLFTAEAQIMDATGGYWNEGTLTLNFIDIDENSEADKEKKYKKITINKNKANERIVRMPVINPCIPFNYNNNLTERFTRELDKNGDEIISDAEKKYVKEYADDTSKMIPKNIGMWAEHYDRTPDTYFLGGKSKDNVGHTAVYHKLTGHEIDDKDTNNPLNLGIITNTVKDKEARNFTIVLGAFEDLPKLYINMSRNNHSSFKWKDDVKQFKPSTWTQVFVGQYTSEKYSSKTNKDSMPILHKSSNDSSKYRPQTIHMLKNDKDQMLVREYEYTFVTNAIKEESETVLFAYPATGEYHYLEHRTDGRRAVYSNDSTKWEKDPDGKTRGSSESEWKSEMQNVKWAAEWKGNYTWVETDFKRYKDPDTQFSIAEKKSVYDKATKDYIEEDIETTTHEFTKFATGGDSISLDTVHPVKPGKVCVPRQFFWQELVGYSLEKETSTRSDRYGEPALIQDGLAFVGAKKERASTSRTYARAGSDGATIPVGFDEAYQRSPYFMSDASRKKPAYNPSGLEYPGFLVDANDPIPVRNPQTGQLENKKSMNDFLFNKTFRKENEKGEKEEIVRPALPILIAYEDVVGGDYNYHDMIFTIWVAPTVEMQVKKQISIGASNKSWWERDERDGLQGTTSHSALGVNKSAESVGTTAKDVRDEHVALLKITGDSSDKEQFFDNVWSMTDKITDDYTEYPKAHFGKNPKGFSNGRLDVTVENVKKFLDKYREENESEKLFYYNDNDLLEFVQEDLKTNDRDLIEKWYNTNTNELKKDEIHKALTKANLTIDGYAGSITFRHVDERFNHLDKKKISLDGDAEALSVREDPMAMRNLAAEIIGYAKQNVPVVDTSGYSRIDANVPATMRSLGFLAGEILLDPARDAVKDGIVAAGECIPVRSDVLTFNEPDMRGKNRTDVVKGFFAAKPKDAVAMCYVDYYEKDPVTKEKVQIAYGPKERRYSIGFHRSGTDASLIDSHSQDHMEIVALGVAKYLPYRNTGSPSTFIANERSGSEEKGYTYSMSTGYDADLGVNYLEDEDKSVAPSFVFDKPIDGAGAMVVNGNLVIRDTFAYYGSLVVLGDLIVIPTKKENQIVWSNSGKPLDKYGNELYTDPATAWNGRPETINSVTWYYDSVVKNKDTVYYEDDGKTVKMDAATKAAEKVVPFLQTTYRGELIAQGNVSVKGRVLTGEVVGEDGKTYIGRVEAYWSSEALKDAGDAYSQGGASVERISWVNDDGINVDTIWNDKLDKPEEAKP